MARLGFGTGLWMQILGDGPAARLYEGIVWGAEF